MKRTVEVIFKFDSDEQAQQFLTRCCEFLKDEPEMVMRVLANRRFLENARTQ